MYPITYNIPVDLFPAHAGRCVIVRVADPSELALKLSDADLGKVQYFQILSPDIEPDNIETLSAWGRDIPVDILIDDPVAQFPQLYNFAKLVDKHPIRASIAVTAGFGKAIKLALALRFAVKLEIGQPAPELIEELNEVLDLYMHGRHVSQPVEFFHSIFLSEYRQEEVSMWMVQEDDPDHFRFVTDDGFEMLSRRFAATGHGQADGSQGPIDITAGAPGEPECTSCEFFGSCRGYFKWPESDYDCSGVKSIFRTIADAANELRENVGVLAATQGGRSNDA